MGFLRRDSETREARRQENEARKAASRARWDEARAEQRRKDAEEFEARLSPRLAAILEEGETVQVRLETGEVLMKKIVVLTDRRLIVMSKASLDQESFPYRSIASWRELNFITKDAVLSVVGRDSDLSLCFKRAEDRDLLLSVLNSHAA
jgi:hypothetical protein